jgi:hemoglobin
MVSFIRVSVLLCCVFLVACANQSKAPESLYDEVGGQPTMVKITDNFIEEISFNRTIYAYFAKTKIDRFREKFIEYLCVSTGGPCQYTGDTMLRSHQGQKITEADFNTTVDLLVAAMKDAGLTYPQQNRVLEVLAKTRREMLYQ